MTARPEFTLDEARDLFEAGKSHISAMHYAMTARRYWLDDMIDSATMGAIAFEVAPHGIKTEIKKAPGGGAEVDIEFHGV